jgi:four helix bundle protein
MNPEREGEGGRGAGRVYDLEDRLVEFAGAVSEVVERLPRTRVGRHAAGQLLRAGTTAAPNYGEAQSAESRKDFVHKLRVCLKELRETMVWLKYTRRMRVGDAGRTEACIREANELISIFVASIATAERNDRRTS